MLFFPVSWFSPVWIAVCGRSLAIFQPGCKADGCLVFVRQLLRDASSLVVAVLCVVGLHCVQPLSGFVVVGPVDHCLLLV